MQAIKPIETRYTGCRFRSRLEARWAVFFDALKIKWEYEPEGYVLPNGECYLPDFVLRHHETNERFWVEIKGETPTDEELIKFEQLVSNTNCIGGSLYVGLPFLDWPKSDVPVDYHWLHCPGEIYHDSYTSCDSFISVIDDLSGTNRFTDWWTFNMPKDAPNPFKVAIEAARSKRFEFGE